VSHIQELGESFLTDFDQGFASLPKDLCAPFRKLASDLEINLISLFRTNVILVRDCENLDDISKSWGALVTICDAASKRLQDLVNEHPYCNAEDYQDRILDIRNKCNRLKEMHS